MEEVKRRYHALAFLCGLNRKRYQGLLDELAHSFLNGRNAYPKTLASVKKLATELHRFQKEDQNPRANDGAAFATESGNEVRAHTAIDTKK